MKIPAAAASVALASTLLVSIASAQAADISCIDTATDKKQLEFCGMDALVERQDAAQSEYARVARAIGHSREMYSVLWSAKEGYEVYINQQCMLEWVAATVQPSTLTWTLESQALEAQKVWMRCIARIAGDVITGLKPLLAH